MHFTQEERQVINRDFKKAIELLIDMATKAQLGDQEITFPIGYKHDVDYTSLGYESHPKFLISESEICICFDNGYKKGFLYLYEEGKVCYSILDENFTFDCLFLREFPQIKAKVAAYLKEYTNKKWSFWKRFMDSHKKNQALFDEVIIDFPESIDQHTFTLEEKNSQKIGTINFGERSIRIITSGNIVLETQSEAKKVKKK